MGFRTGIPFFLKNLFRRLAEKTGHCERVLFLVIFGTRTMSLSRFKAGKEGQTRVLCPRQGSLKDTPKGYAPKFWIKRFISIIFTGQSRCSSAYSRISPGWD